MIRRFALCASVAFAATLLVSTGALATPVTFTFDNGVYDDTITAPPNSEIHGPFDYIESGIRAAGFWAKDVGTPGAFFQQGHTHISEDASGRPDAAYEHYHAWTNDLLGLYVSLENGGTFDLVSIDVSLRIPGTTTDPLLQPLAWTFGPDAPQMLVSTSFDPTLSDFESQWTPFAVNDPNGFGFFTTTPITGFTGITGFYLSGTAVGLGFDNIVLDINGGGTVVPEPSSALLVGIGLFGFGTRRRRKA